VVLHRVFWRATARNPPEEVDFYSYERLGKPLLRDTPAARRRARGVSVFDSLDTARRKAAERRLGDYIAELHVPDDGSIGMEEGIGGHWTIYGDSEALRRCVVSVVPAVASGE